MSDGKHYAQAMIVTQLNELINTNMVKRYSVVRVTRYNVSIIQGRKLLILMEMKPLSGPEEGLTKIGSPDTLAPGTAVGGGQSTTSSSMPAAAPLPTNSASYSHSPSSRADQFSTSGKSADSDKKVTFKIRMLSPYQNKWTIRARAINKSDVRTWSNQKGEGKLFSVTFMDESGEIRATAFNDSVTQFYDLIQDGKVYYVSNAVVKVVTNRQYSAVNNEYELSFNQATTIIPCTDSAGDVPDVEYDFTPLSQLGAKNKDDSVDVLAVVHECADLSEIVSQRTQRKLLKRELTLVGRDEFAVKMTLWGTQAENFRLTSDGQYGLHPVLAVRKAKVGDFGGRQLSVAQTSTMAVNPEIQEAHVLRGWYDSTGSQMSSWKTFSTSNAAGLDAGSTSNREERFLSLAELAGGAIGTGTKPDFFSVRGIVDRVNDNIAYAACPSENCNRKVIEGSEGWHCENCNRSFPQPEYRYILSLLVLDFSGTQWMTAFNDAALSLVGNRSANELVEMQKGNPEEAKQALETCLHKEFILQVRAKMDTFQDVTKLRVTIMRAEPVDFVSDSRKLIDSLERYMASTAIGKSGNGYQESTAWPM